MAQGGFYTGNTSTFHWYIYIRGKHSKAKIFKNGNNLNKQDKQKKKERKI